MKKLLLRSSTVVLVTSVSLTLSLHLLQMLSSSASVLSDGQAKTTADNEDVDIRFYSVIYHAINDIEAALHGMLEPILRSRKSVRLKSDRFSKASGVSNIAGSMVTER